MKLELSVRFYYDCRLLLVIMTFIYKLFDHSFKKNIFSIKSIINTAIFLEDSKQPCDEISFTCVMSF